VRPATQETAGVRRLLRHLDDARELRKNELVGHLFESQGERAPKAQANIAAMARLRALVHRALDRIEPQSEGTARAAARDRRLHAIVARCDVAGEKHEAVARDLGLSLRQFYRERNVAFARLTDAMHEELAASDASGRRHSHGREARHNLPWQPTSFIGRAREIRELSDLIAQQRLVTITGSGGTGKTRTALEVASRFSPPCDGIWFVDLAAINDGAFLVGRVAAALDVPLPEREDVTSALLESIKDRNLLLVLDNCEHVIHAARRLADAILRACPQIALLATSRERLGIAGEQTYQLSPLPVPGAAVTTAAEGRCYAAFELFAQRATTAQYGIEFSGQRFEAAADICRRLDGIALAIELAATRLPVLGLDELRRQLAEHFRVISGGSACLPGRQQTLDATIAWSYDLLEERERVVFRRLAIFVNGWSLEAAAAVCADASLEQSAVLDALFSLVEKSLAVVDLDADTPRYSFFESTRAYALEKLVACGEHAVVALRHARWMAVFADRAHDDFFVTPRSRWGAIVVPELDNALAALEWAHAPGGDAVLGAVIAGSLTGLWLVVGLPAYGRRYVNASIERLDAREHPALVARLLLAQSQFLRGAAIEDALKRAVSLVERSDDRRILARCYVYLAYTQLRMGKYPQAEEASDKAAMLLREEGLQNSPFYSRLLTDRSILFRSQGRLDEAHAALAEGLHLATALQDDWLIALCQSLLAEIEFTNGDPLRAVALGEEALRGARRVRQETFFLLSNLACYHLAAGEIEAVEAYAREAVDLSRSNLHDVGAVVQHLAAVAALRGEATRAARLLGYSNAYYERVGCLRDATDQIGFDILMRSLREQLREDDIAALAAQGAQLSRDAAVAEALS
jgi:predicted ATPase